MQWTTVAQLKHCKHKHVDPMLILIRRLRRSPNIIPALGERALFARKRCAFRYYNAYFSHSVSAHIALYL